MFCIASERLRMIPLKYEHLLLYQHQWTDLERILELAPSAIQTEPDFEAEVNEALHNFWLPNTRIYPDLYYWYTNWLIVLKNSNTCVGGIGFGGYPDDYGETSVGYMVDKMHQGKGYATEALCALATWGFGYTVLKRIGADAHIKNPGSQRVLLKAGFMQTHLENELVYFKRYK